MVKTRGATFRFVQLAFHRVEKGSKIVAYLEIAFADKLLLKIQKKFRGSRGSELLHVLAVDFWENSR